MESASRIPVGDFRTGLGDLVDASLFWVLACNFLVLILLELPLENFAARPGLEAVGLFYDWVDELLVP